MNTKVWKLLKKVDLNKTLYYGTCNHCY